MLANINLACGLATFLGWGVGAGLFVITLFSFSHGIILGGLILAVLVALFLFAVFYRWIARMPPKDRAPAATVVVVALHALLLTSNVIATLFGVPLVYGAIFDPSVSNAVPVTEAGVFASVVTCVVLSVGLLVERAGGPLDRCSGSDRSVQVAADQSLTQPGSTHCPSCSCTARSSRARCGESRHKSGSGRRWPQELR